MTFWTKSVKTSRMFGLMAVQYDDICISNRKVYEWTGNFKGGRTNVDDAHSRRPWITSKMC